MSMSKLGIENIVSSSKNPVSENHGVAAFSASGASISSAAAMAAARMSSGELVAGTGYLPIDSGKLRTVSPPFSANAATS
ncbi:hypothetical protein Lal_00016649 [Lupinus albus]|nr:hypothetical protein Lal_00016649 [Lupinus albus]